MDVPILLLILLQVILIALNAVFACTEIAVISINDTKLERLAAEGSIPAKRLFKLTREPAKFLATIQVAITLSGFLGSAFAADNFSEPLVDWLIGLGLMVPRGTLDAISVIVITLVLSYFTLVFGELVPKRLAMKKPEQIATKISGLISFISGLTKPIVWFLSISTNAVLRICGVDPHAAEDEVSEDEIRMLVEAGSEKGTIDYHEKEFIQNVFEFNDMDTGDIATRRTDVDVLWLEDSDEAWAETIHESRHTRYPICGESQDHIIGILNAKDYFRLKDKNRENVLSRAVSDPYFVPETIRADILLRTMQREHHSLAIVIDEYGGMVGIVTFYDLIEELVGELHEEPEDPADRAPYLEPLGEHIWKVMGNVTLRDIEDVTGLDFGNRDYGTVTGLVFDSLKRIPEDGNPEIDLEIPDMQMKICICRVESHQIEEAVITLLPKDTVIKKED